MTPEQLRAEADQAAQEFAAAEIPDETTGIPKPPRIEVTETETDVEPFGLNFEEPETASEAPASGGGGGGGTPPCVGIIRCFNISWSATVTGTSYPTLGIGIFLHGDRPPGDPMCGPPGSECGNHASSCAEGITVNGVTANNGPAFDCSDAGDCTCQESDGDTDYDQGHESTSHDWPCQICCAGSSVDNVPFFYGEIDLTYDPVTCTWTAVCLPSVIFVLAVCHSLSTEACITIQPEWGGGLVYDNQLPDGTQAREYPFNLGRDPVGTHVFTFLGAVTGLTYQFTLVVA